MSIARSADTVPDVAVKSPAQSRRRARFAAQRVMWRESSLKGVRKCGRRVIKGATGVQLRVSDGANGRHAGFAGLQTCGSVWGCAVCSARILGGRQGEISTAVTNWRAGGGKIAMATFTMKHRKGQSLATLWDALGDGWHAVTSGGAYSAEKVGYGVATTRVVKSGKRRGETVDCDVLPWVRVVEVTEGAQGWHVHVHMIAFLPRATTRVQLGELYDGWWKRWDSGLTSAGVDGSLRVNRADFYDDEASEALGDYVTKNTYSAADRLGLEVARGDLKDGRWNNRSAMQLLRDVVLQPEGRDVIADVALWHEFEQASKGRKQMTWGVGSRALLGLVDVELTDEELAAQEVGTVADSVIELPLLSWREISDVAGRRAEVLETAERPGDSITAVGVLLDSWGLLWWRYVEPGPTVDL